MICCCYNSTAESNIIDFPEELKFHSHEEADTLILLHSIEVDKRNPFCQLYVEWSDTDVLLLLLYFYPQICNNTVFHANTRQIDVACAYNELGNEKSMALLGFHAFTGCDLTGKFSGFSKTTCFDTFLKSNSFVYKAFASLGNYDDGLKEGWLDTFRFRFVSTEKTIKCKYFRPITLLFIFEISIRF